MSQANSNPFFGHNQLPAYSKIQASDLEPAMETLIAELEKGLAELESTVKPTYESVVVGLRDLTEGFEFAWTTASHLMAVNNSDELRKAYEAVQPRVVATGLRLLQSKPIYTAMRQLKDSEEWQGLSETQQRIIETSILNFEHGGVALEGAAQKRFQEIAAEIAELSTKFTNNVLDSIKDFALDLKDTADIAGLPDGIKALAAQAYAQANSTEPDPQNGPWRFTLDIPSMLPFVQHSTRRDLREKLYRASTTKASSGDRDNQPIALKILELRKEQSALLGYPTFADLSLSEKMAPGVDAVFRFIEEVQQPALPKASAELAELTEYARAKTGDSELELENWDTTFWSERMREERYDYTDEQIRPFFPLDQVLTGLFDISRKLFGVTFEQQDPGESAWDPEVRLFKVIDSNGEQIASFFLDPYSRPQNKRGGAWMSQVLERKKMPDGSIRLPVAILNCNQTPPVGDVPSLMNFIEVNTLFHEFGHGIQHMLTEVDEPEAAGISNVEWDAVELPSTFMQNWCYHRDTIMGIARHYQTGEQLDEQLFERLQGARTYMSGLMVTRQNFFSTLDMELHHLFDPEGNETILDRSRDVASRTLAKQPDSDDRFFCSFQHIFSGGYAAGYYSYMWAAVLAADAFAAFEEAGTSDESKLAEVGQRFRKTVLGLGGSRHPLKVFQDFRGREPSTEPLMRQLNLK